MEGFGNRLKELRGNQRQADVAEKMGIKPPTYAMYENDMREPNFHTLNLIADYYGVTVDYLLGRTECRSPDIDEQAICKKTGLSEKSVKQLIGLCNRDPRSLHDDLDDRFFSDLLYDAVRDFINMRIESYETLPLTTASYEIAFIEAEGKKIMSNYRTAAQVLRKEHPMIAQWMSSPPSHKESLFGRIRDASNIETSYFIDKIKETKSFQAMKQKALEKPNEYKELFAFQELLHGKSDIYSPADWE